MIRRIVLGLGLLAVSALSATTARAGTVDLCNFNVSAQVTVNIPESNEIGSATTFTCTGFTFNQADLGTIVLMDPNLPFVSDIVTLANVTGENGISVATFTFVSDPAICVGELICTDPLGLSLPVDARLTVTEPNPFIVATAAVNGQQVFLTFNSDDAAGGLTSDSITATATPTPEPATLSMFGSGLLALGGLLRRKLKG